MAASAWQFLLSQPASTLSEQVRELSPEQIRNLLHALSDGLVDIASVPTSTSAASSQASAPTGPPALSAATRPAAACLRRRYVDLHACIQPASRSLRMRRH